MFSSLRVKYRLHFSKYFESSKTKHINFRKDRSLETLSKIGRTEWIDNFSTYFELENYEIRLKNYEFEKKREKGIQVLLQRIRISIFEKIGTWNDGNMTENQGN